MRVVPCIIAMIVFGATLAALPLAIRHLFPDEYDEAMAQDRRAANSRGDTVAEYDRSCGFGVFDQSIVLQLAGAEKLTTLAKFQNLHYAYPKFHWINDNNLNVELGSVRGLSSLRGKAGNIRISYTYTMADKVQ
ncbi:hypothetical protein SAMN05444581_10611 [Methylocapsa palsarum]|uniref:Uncharacterized protein n=2 Tax=Methylocapsa palsarum TaxID=1612308 RepID=A0A1I3YK10_9HYPH|nr:hypothetical protein SAMN05444581_10611 [Methylocapsa palsarum]